MVTGSAAATESLLAVRDLNPDGGGGPRRRPEPPAQAGSSSSEISGPGGPQYGSEQFVQAALPAAAVVSIEVGQGEEVDVANRFEQVADDVG